MSCRFSTTDDMWSTQRSKYTHKSAVSSAFLPSHTSLREHRRNAFVIVTVIDGSKLASKMGSLHVFLQQFLPFQPAYNPVICVAVDALPRIHCENICRLNFDGICLGRLTCSDLPSKSFLLHCTMTGENRNFSRLYQVFILLLRTLPNYRWFAKD